MMHQDKVQNNKRIAKNSLILYMRLFLMMGISLYTGRVILHMLGVTDYGIYNVVAGVVVSFSFITGTMQAACQRFLTFALGKGDMQYLKIVFSVTQIVHWVLVACLILFGETVGLWLVNNQLVIPEERLTAALWVYQFSIISSCISLISVPYNGIIIAYERMDVFAFISILEAILKLFIVFVLMWFDSDRLILYGVLCLVVTLIIRGIYTIYTKKHFEVVNINFFWDKSLFKEIFSFATWSLLPSFSMMLLQQGISILLNVFFGPAINAARGLSAYFQALAQQFASSFQVALNPQIIKSYAQGNLGYMHSLIFRSSKFTFIFVLIIILPLVIETPFILTLWLGEYPEYTVGFARYSMFIILLDATSNPFMIAAEATGEVKKYNIVIGGIMIFVVPIGYFAFELGASPVSILAIHLFIAAVCFLARPLLVCSKISMSAMLYFKEVIIPALITCVISFLLLFVLRNFLCQNFLSVLLISIFSVIVVLTVGYLIILKKNEKEFVLSIIKSRLQLK